MLTEKMKEEVDLITKEALHILAISGKGKDAKDTYERAQSTLGMVDIAVRMAISEMEYQKAKKKKSQK